MIVLLLSELIFNLPYKIANCVNKRSVIWINGFFSHMNYQLIRFDWTVAFKIQSV